MSDGVGALLELSDLDSVERQALTMQPRLRRIGLDTVDARAFERERTKLVERVEKRWLAVYERGRQRYGSGVTSVKDRVCQGCYFTLPTSAAPPLGERVLLICPSCGRLLCWG